MIMVSEEQSGDDLTYRFDQLPKSVQREVLVRHNDINVDWDWYELEYESFKEELIELGLKAEGFNWGFDRNRFLYMEGLDVVNQSLFFEKANLSRYEMLLKFDEVGIYDINLSGSYKYESNYCSMDIEWHSEPNDSPEKNDEVNKLIGEMEEKINEFIKELATKFLKQLEESYEYLISDEAIIDTFNANDYRFDIEGRIVR